MRALCTLVVLTVAAWILPATGSSVAHAQTCSYSNRCYALADLGAASGSGFYGIKANIRVNCTVANDNSFILSALWLNNNDTGQYWVEVGIATGEVNGVWQSIPRYYWADMRQGG